MVSAQQQVDPYGSCFDDTFILAGSEVDLS